MEDFWREEKGVEEKEELKYTKEYTKEDKQQQTLRSLLGCLRLLTNYHY